MKHNKARLVWVIGLLLTSSLACQLTSPRPASWAGTPTAAAWATEIAITQAAIAGAGEFVFTPTVPTPTQAVSPTPTPTPTPISEGSGPWLVYPAPGGGGLHAYDLSAERIRAIHLPDPLISADLVRGRSPNGHTLIVRAGSELNTDELALYQIDLPSFEVSKITPLLSLTVQRMIATDQNTRALDTLAVVTRPDGLAWSPDGRFLAFNAALHNETSDLYVLDTLNERIDRLNGLFTQNASPFWSPGSDWLISQELNHGQQALGWRSELVSGLRVPSFDNQNTLYLPLTRSREEVFVGWLNPTTFVSYSLTDEGPQTLRQLNLDVNAQENLIFAGAFQQVAYDPASGVLAYSLTYDIAISQGLTGGIYRVLPDSPVHSLQSAGNWDRLAYDPGGMFLASGAQGVTLLTPDGDSLLLPEEGAASLSPNGNWLVGFGDGEPSSPGARLYQAGSSNPLQTLIETPVEALFWQPDSTGFFILSEGVLYHLEFPGLKPSEIASGFTPSADLALTWVE